MKQNTNLLSELKNQGFDIISNHRLHDESNLDFYLEVIDPFDERLTEYPEIEKHKANNIPVFHACANSSRLVQNAWLQHHNESHIDFDNIVKITVNENEGYEVAKKWLQQQDVVYGVHLAYTTKSLTKNDLDRVYVNALHQSSLTFKNQEQAKQWATMATQWHLFLNTKYPVVQNLKPLANKDLVELLNSDKSVAMVDFDVFVTKITNAEQLKMIHADAVVKDEEVAKAVARSWLTESLCEAAQMIVISFILSSLDEHSLKKLYQDGAITVRTSN